jgi:CubicO group peptidase (beta-lactamase class C family)
MRTLTKGDGVKNTTWGLSIVLGWLATSACVGAADREAEIQSVLDRDVPGLLADNGIPSVSIAHIEDGRIAFAAAYGSQSAGVPATTRTLYNIASMTKPISAEVVLRLASQGRLSLDEPMYLSWTDPDIANDERRKLLTPRRALSHQTGFPNWRRETGGVLTFKHTPGEGYGYSGEGYEYVARFAEKKTATGFETLAQEFVMEPTGMIAAYTGRSWFEGRIAVPTDGQGKALEPTIARTWVASDLLYTTPGDYARFMLSVMRGKGLTTALAKERSRIQVSRKAQECPPGKVQRCPDDVGFGLGWEVFKFGDATYLMHTGKDDGVFTLGYINLSEQTATIIFTNSDNGAKVVLPILDRVGKDRVFVDYLRQQAG